MNNLKEDSTPSQENGFQESLIKLAQKTFVDIFKGYTISLVIFFSLGTLSQYFYGSIALQLLLLLGFSYPLYCNAWGEGYRDLNRFEFKRIESDNLRGFKFALYALIPNFILSFMLLISYFTKSFEMMYIYRAMNIYTIQILNWIASPGILTIDYNIIQILAYILIPPAIVLISVGGGYYLGFTETSILDTIIYKNKNKEKIK